MAVGIDLGAVRGDDGDGRRALGERVGDGGRLTHLGHEATGLRGRDGLSHLVPVFVTDLQERLGPLPLRIATISLLGLVLLERGQLVAQLAKVEHDGPKGF